MESLLEWLTRSSRNFMLGFVLMGISRLTHGFHRIENRAFMSQVRQTVQHVQLVP